MTSPKSSARRAGNEQYLGDTPWKYRATAIKPDARYVVDIRTKVKTHTSQGLQVLRKIKR